MDALVYAGTSYVGNSGLLVIDGGAAKTITTTVTINYCLKGKMFQKGAITNGAVPTTDANTGAAFTSLAASEGNVYVYCLDASGTLKVAEGKKQALDAAGNFILAPQFGPIPDTLVPFAYQVIKNGATGSAWLYGTNNWNATGITSSIKNGNLPDRPQVA